MNGQLKHFQAVVQDLYLKPRILSGLSAKGCSARQTVQRGPKLEPQMFDGVVVVPRSCLRRETPVCMYELFLLALQGNLLLKSLQKIRTHEQAMWFAGVDLAQY